MLISDILAQQQRVGATQRAGQTTSRTTQATAATTRADQRAAAQAGASPEVAQFTTGSDGTKTLQTDSAGNPVTKTYQGWQTLYQENLNNIDSQIKTLNEKKTKTPDEMARLNDLNASRDTVSALLNSQNRIQTNSSEALVDAAGNPTARGIMNQAIKSAALKGGEQVYDPKTGSVTLPMDRFQQHAVERLMKPPEEGGAGMTIEQAQARWQQVLPEIQAIMANSGQGGSYDEKGNYIPPAVTPGQSTGARDSRVAAIDSRIAELNQPLPETGLYSYMDQRQAADLLAAREKEKASLAAEKAALIAKGAMENPAPIAGVGTEAKTTQETQMSGTGQIPPAGAEGAMPPGTTDANGNVIQPAQGQYDAMAGQAKKTLESTLDIIDQDPLDVTKQIDSADAALEAQLDITNSAKQLQDDKALELERAKLAANDRARQLAEVENVKAQLDQQKLNEQNELKSRRRIAKLTGNYDMSGMDFVQRNIQDGLDSLNYLRSKAAVMQADFADSSIAIINQYGLDLRQNEQDAKVGYQSAYDGYRKSLNDLAEDLRLDKSERRKQKIKAHEDYQKTLNDMDMKKADFINDVRLKSIDRMTALEKAQITANQNEINNAIKMMAMATKKGVKMSREALNNFERLVAPNMPAGWFSFAATGSGTGGSSYKTWTPEGFAAAADWVSVDPTHRDISQLRPADQEWLLMPQTVAGPGLKPEQARPQYGQAPEPTVTGYLKEYDELVKRDKTFADRYKPEDYVNARTWGNLEAMARSVASKQSREPAPDPAPAKEEDDTTIDTLVNQEAFDPYADEK